VTLFSLSRNGAVGRFRGGARKVASASARLSIITLRCRLPLRRQGNEKVRLHSRGGRRGRLVPDGCAPWDVAVRDEIGEGVTRDASPGSLRLLEM
jgi:hypothetical protein